MLPPELSIALKEWSVVCDALADGRQIVLLRKGGIYESAGEFEVEHRQFVLFPTVVHQKAEHLKESERSKVMPQSAEPDRILIRAAGEVTDIIELRDRAQMDAIDDAHIWAPPLIDMRFNYRPENPLYLLIVRAWRLPQPVEIANTIAYAGCKSWVPLDQPVRLCDAVPALDDAAFESRRADIRQRIK